MLSIKAHMQFILRIWKMCHASITLQYAHETAWKNEKEKHVIMGWICGIRWLSWLPIYVFMIVFFNLFFWTLKTCFVSLFRLWNFNENPIFTRKWILKRKKNFSKHFSVASSKTWMDNAPKFCSNAPNNTIPILKYAKHLIAQIPIFIDWFVVWKVLWNYSFSCAKPFRRLAFNGFDSKKLLIIICLSFKRSILFINGKRTSVLIVDCLSRFYRYHWLVGNGVIPLINHL